MENKNDVKGGLVIEQMKRYAKRLSDHTGNSVNIRIEVWYHPKSENITEPLSVDFVVWDAAKSRFISMPYIDCDLRAVGKKIDEVIASENAVASKLGFFGHMGE